MFSSAPEKDQWGPRFDSPPSTSTTASQANATGRKRKANFSNDETETLVWNVVRHFSALYGSESFRAHPVRRKQLWTQIQSRVNFLGYTERSIDDLKHKWRDLRLDVKKKITAKKPPALHRPGPPHKPRLTPLEKMVASTFLQPTHDSEPEIVLDPEIFFPGASKPSLLPMPPGASHPSIYIDTNGQPSSLPDMESSPVPSLGVQNPDPSMVCDYSRGEGQSRSESGPDLRTPDRSAVSPPVRNDSLVSYGSDEEEGEGHEVDSGGLEPPLLAEEDGKVSGRKAVLIRRCGSQGSVASVLEETLGHGDPHSDWGHGGPSDIPLLDRGLDSSQPEEEEEREEVVSQSTESGPLPQRPMGSTWEKEDEGQQPQQPFSAGALTEESLPSSASPQVEQVSRGIGASHQHETWRTPLHRLMDMEDQWDQLYHHELATWQEERAQQREERARDRELQFRLLAVLTDIRDELRHLREERAAARPEKAASRQEQASQTMLQVSAPESAPSKPVGAPPVVPPETPSGFPLKTEGVHSGPSLARAARGEAAAVPRSPHGVSRRGRGRPRGSMSKHKRFLTNSS